MGSPIPLEEAQERLLALAAALPAETVPIEEALGRCLAAPLLTRRIQPAADLSAMDGYALRLADSPGPWRVVGESAAGHPFRGTLGSGEAIRISTGALMPDGADAVLLQENAMREGDALSLNGAGEPTARHIRRKGFDFTEGMEALAKGTRIGPAQVALAIAAGHASVQAHRLPRLAVLDSGDELSADPGACAVHQIPASNGAMLAAMAAPFAGDILRLGPVPDTMEAMTKALEATGDCDVIVTSGGVSVGDHDLVRPALEAWGAEIDFWRVAIKPGKPILVATRGRQIVVGLPGNPVSSYVTAFLFLLPLVRALAGDAAPLPRAIAAPFSRELPAGGARREFLRAFHDGHTLRPVAEQDSSALFALSAANALIVRREHGAATAKGGLVEAYLLGNGGIA